MAGPFVWCEQDDDERDEARAAASIVKGEPVGVPLTRLVLTFTDGSASQGKASANSDIVEARFVDIVPGVRVVQAVDFVSDDPAYAGTMTMTWEVTAADGGARVDITADDVPDGITAQGCSAGLASS